MFKFLIVQLRFFGQISPSPVADSPAMQMNNMPTSLILATAGQTVPMATNQMTDTIGTKGITRMSKATLVKLPRVQNTVVSAIAKTMGIWLCNGFAK